MCCECFKKSEIILYIFFCCFIYFVGFYLYYDELVLDVYDCVFCGLGFRNVFNVVRESLDYLFSCVFVLWCVFGFVDNIMSILDFCLMRILVL